MSSETEGESPPTTRRAELNSTKVRIDSRVKAIGIVTSLTTFNDLDMLETEYKDRSLKHHDAMLVLMFAFGEAVHP